MVNSEIIRLEENVIRLQTSLKLFNKDIQNLRTSENYNYLGTLDVNLKVLKNRINDVIATLNF
jgi:hypothetical protein